MKISWVAPFVLVTCVLVGSQVVAQDQHNHEHGGATGRLGSVHFVTSCRPSVEKTPGLAHYIIHSFDSPD